MPDSSRGAGTGRLALKIFLVVLVAVAVVAGTEAVLRFAVAPQPAAAPSEAVSRAWAAFTAEQRDRYARLGLAGRVLAREEALRTVLRGVASDDEGAAGSAALLDLLLQRRDELGYDFAIAFDADGRVVAATDRPDLVGRDLTSQPLVGRGLEEGTASGVWNIGDGRLAHAAVEWVAPEFDLLGFVLVALELDDVLALEIQRTTGAGAAFLLPSGPEGSGPRPVSSSLGAAATDGLVRQLGQEGGPLRQVLGSGDTREEVSLDLAGTPYRALLAPLRDAGGRPAGAVVLAAPRAEEASDGTLPWLAVATVVALLLGLFLALALARATLSPVRRLAALVGDAPHEGYARRPEPRRAGHLAPLASALGRLFRDLQEERALSAAAQGAVGTEDGAAGGEAEERKGVLLGVDLRRYARLGAGGEEAREVAEHLGRDIARVRSLVDAHGGRLAVGAGHRLFAGFEGEDAEWRAVQAAAAVLAALGARDSAFDEGEPPALALAPGRTAGGSTTAGGHFLVGPAVQLVESLLREAVPGDLVMPRPLHSKVADRLARAEAFASEQSAVLSPQPLFVLSGEAASRVVAADEAPALRLPGFDDDGSAATPSPVHRAVVAGDVVEDRFEVLAVQPGSPSGDLLRARDRELGDEVALRRLPSDAVSRPEAAAVDGALGAARRFTHPGVARFYDFLEVPGGVLLSRQWVPGAPVAALRELPTAAVLGLGRQLVSALAAVHDAGLVHGRVKPENVVVVPGAGARLTDLGLGLLAGPEASASAGRRLLAPEQREGRLGDARADVYALGALLARLATGGWWSGEEGEAVPEGEAAEPLPEGLEAVLRRCLAADPEARYADAGQVRDALAPVSV